MSLGSPAEILPFTRSLTCRQRLQRIAVMTGTVVMPPSTDMSIRPESPDTSNDHGRSARSTPVTVHVSTLHGAAIVSDVQSWRVGAASFGSCAPNRQEEIV